MRRPGAASVRAVALAVAFVCGGTGVAGAQEIRFDPRPDRPSERDFARFLDAAGYVIVDADTTLGPESRIDGDLLILEADVRIAGTVTGDVAAIGGALFLRPGARIEGDVLALGGGYYSSQRAEIAGALTWRPNDVYEVVREGEGRLRIRPIREVPETLTLHGLSGILFPTYQRVDEWTFGLGATARVTAWDWQPSLEAEVRFKTERGDFEGTVRQAWYPSASLQFGAEAERATLTNEAWVRGDIANTLSFFLTGDDFRNYYEADRVAVFLRGTETARWSPIVEVEWEKARSLAAEPQFVLFGDDDDVVPNPAIDPGEAVLARGGAEYRRRGNRSDFSARGLLEAADSSVAGDFTYLLGELRVRWDTPGPSDHSIEVFGLLRHDLSGELPRQRWVAVGGLATLPRVPLLSERGPRFAYGQATYLVPIERLRLGLLGPPRVFLRAASGAAWEEGGEAGFETNLIAGVRLFVFEAALAVDPGASDLDPAFYATLRFPGDL